MGKILIPTVRVLKDFNKLLLFVKELSSGSNFPDKEAVFRAASSLSIGDKKGHHDTLNFLVTFGFVSETKNKCQITPLGDKFLQFNPKRYIETTNDQKKFILNLFIHNKKTKALLSEILQVYGSSTTTHLIIDPRDPLLSQDQLSLLDVFRWLELFKSENLTFQITPEHVKTLAKIKNNEMSLKQLNLIMSEELKYSKKAEEHALEFEQKRLRKLGKAAHANLVRIVSEENVMLGYDLISFDGSRGSVKYDRFIEVKCSKGNKIRFFWTLNELKVAQKLKKKYWIYFFSNTHKQKVPIIFNNPAQTFRPPKYKVISSEFIVEEI